MCLGEVMFIKDLLGDITAMDAHILENLHVRAEKEVFEVAGTVASATLAVGDGAVDMKFGVDNADSGRSNVLKRIETVAANRHANAVGFRLARAHAADKSCIGDFAASGNLVRADKKHGAIAENPSAGSAIF